MTIAGVLDSSAAVAVVAVAAVGVTSWLGKRGRPLLRHLNESLAAGRHARAVHAAFVRELPAAALLRREPLAIPARDPTSASVDTADDIPAQRVRDIVHNHPEGVFLTGEPGAGKTTTLRWLEDVTALEALEAGGYANTRGGIPVFVALPELPDRYLESPQSIIDAIERTLLVLSNLPHDGAGLGSVIDDVARDFGLLVLLDGVDSVIQRSGAVQEVMRLFRDMPNVTVVASGRTGVGNASSLPQFELLGLRTAEERSAFLSAHAKVRGEKETSGSERYQRILGLDLTKDLLSNPSILWIADQNVDRLSVPVTRAKLYAAHWELTQERAWPSRRERESMAPQALEVLSAHCYHTLLSPYSWAEAAFELGGWEEWMDRHGGHIEAKQVLDRLADTSYLLSRGGPTERPYVFVHPTFVEYFAAVYLGNHVKGGSLATMLPTYLQHPSLDNLIVLFAGMVPVQSRATVLNVLLEWDLELAAKAVSEWPDSELAYRLPPDGRLLVEARAWEAALTWLDEHPDAPWAGGVAAELADRDDTRTAALTWLEGHPDARLSRQVARELARYESARPVALAWLREHPEDEWAGEAALELVGSDDARQRMVAWLDDNPSDPWATRVACALAHHDDTRWAVLAWLAMHPEGAEAGRVARELADYDDTRDAVLEWLRVEPGAHWAGHVAGALADHEETRGSAQAWLDSNPEHVWAGRVASELAGHEESRRSALVWLQTDPGAEWASLVAWKLAYDERSRRAMLGWLRVFGEDKGAGRVASELADHDDTRWSAREWLENQPNARWAGRVARRLADYGETRPAVREWLHEHPEDEWAGMVAAKLAFYSDSRPAMVAWLRQHPKVPSAGRVASELADHDDSRPAVLSLLEERTGEIWSAKVLAEHYDVRLKSPQASGDSS